MLKLADEVQRNLQPLIGLKLSRMARAADMTTIQFGDTETRNGGGVVGQYAVHIQCPWRLEDDRGLITGDDDLYVASDPTESTDSFDWEKGGSLQDKVLRHLLQGFDASTGQIVNVTNLLVVEAVVSDSCGGFSLGLSSGYRFLVFPSGLRREAWRIFRPSTDSEERTGDHFVIPLED